MTAFTMTDRIDLAAAAHAALLAVSAKEQALTMALVQASIGDTFDTMFGNDGHAAADADPIITALRQSIKALEAARVSIMSIDPMTLPVA